MDLTWVSSVISRGLGRVSQSCTWVAALSIPACIISVQLFRYYFIFGVPCKSTRKLDGKTAIITGANTGIGKETAIDLAKRGARVIVACRDEKRALAALKDIKDESGSDDVVFKKLDLASLSSVRSFSEEVLSEEEHIDILINNAGVMIPPYTKTEDGFELQFGVNHLGHFLLTMLLLDRIKESAPSRIVNVSSVVHYAGKLDFNDMMWEKSYSAMPAYGRSKLANVMFTRELAKRLAGTEVTVYSLHPGSISTELQRYAVDGWKVIFKPLLLAVKLLFFKTPVQGAQTTIYCAVSEECEGITGKYWDDSAIKKPNKVALNDDDCKRLWEYSLDAVGLKE